MGNCLFGGVGEADGEEAAVKVITSSGGIMEFCAPVTAGCITSEFPGHAIFRSHNLFWKPLCCSEELTPGRSYYLLLKGDSDKDGQIVRQGHVRSSSIPASLVTPYRMSLDYQGTLKRSYTEVFSRHTNNYNSNNNNNKSDGFWKVKLVISPDHLLQILSQEAATQELIESVRTVAKCGNATVSSSSSAVFSDQWSLSSSRHASSKKDLLLLDL